MRRGRPGLKKRFLALSLLFLSAVAKVLYAFLIEPYRIEVTRHYIPAAITSPLKIAHLSDLHTYGIGKREQLMLTLLQEEQPDLIVLTGDLISDAAGYAGLREVLKRMRAPLGIWIVRGNHENWYPVDKLQGFGDFKSYYESAGANYLYNNNQQVRDDLWIVGLDDEMSGRPDLAKALVGVSDNVFKIAIFHSPAYFDALKGKCDLALAGHSHGGQIRIPFLRPVLLPAGCNGYYEGWYERDGARMYVSRGIGTSILNARFNCRPEIAIITLG